MIDTTLLYPVSVLGNYYGNLFLQQYLVTPGAWLGLHPDDPTVLGDPTTELAGGDYVRQRILFSAPSGKTIVSRNGQTFVGLIASQIRYLVLWDALAGGHMIAALKLLDDGIKVLDSGHFLAAAGDVALTV